MINETKKIMEDTQIKVAATCVRIPVFSGHSESIYIETKDHASVEEVRQWISEAPGAVLQDDPSQQVPASFDQCGQNRNLCWSDSQRFGCRKRLAFMGRF